jgi:phosphoesterase RecJ-like protein
MKIDYNEAAKLLLENDNFCILTHRSPDGDTIGSGFGLYYALKSIDKNACVLCSDEFPRSFAYLYADYVNMKFAPQFFIAVDVADSKLLGNELKKYAEDIDLCVDHHHSNSGFAKNLLLEPDAASASEVVYTLIETAGIPLTQNIAQCLYTGIITDTGCFKYPATTASTHRIAAKLIDTGINHASINRRMFDTKSKTRIAIESYAISHMEYYLDEKCAFTAISHELLQESGATDDDLEGLAPLTTELETVEVGILIKEKDKGRFRVSMRSVKETDVSLICAKFSGGGHFHAAGCQLEGTLYDVRMRLLKAVASAMGIDLWVV